MVESFGNGACNDQTDEAPCTISHPQYFIPVFPRNCDRYASGPASIGMGVLVSIDILSSFSFFPIPLSFCSRILDFWDRNGANHVTGRLDTKEKIPFLWFFGATLQPNASMFFIFWALSPIEPL